MTQTAEWIPDVQAGMVIDESDEDGVKGTYRVIRWCDGEPGYVVYGAYDASWHDAPDWVVGRGFWAVPLDAAGQECGPMRFFAR